MIIIVPLIFVVGIVAWVLRPGKSPTNPRKIAILSTAIPPLIVSIAAVIFQLLHNAAGKTWVSDVANTCFIVSIGLLGAAILVTIGLLIARRWEIAKGIGFGICIGVMICVIELAVLEWLAGV
jgi:hypothetical protein